MPKHQFIAKTPVVRGSLGKLQFSQNANTYRPNLLLKRVGRKMVPLRLCKSKDYLA